MSFPIFNTSSFGGQANEHPREWLSSYSYKDLVTGEIVYINATLLPETNATSAAPSSPVVGSAWSTMTAQVKSNWKTWLLVAVVPGGLLIWFLFFRRKSK